MPAPPGNRSYRLPGGYQTPISKTAGYPKQCSKSCHRLHTRHQYRAPSQGNQNTSSVQSPEAPCSTTQTKVSASHTPPKRPYQQSQCLRKMPTIFDEWSRKTVSSNDSDTTPPTPEIIFQNLKIIHSIVVD